MIWGWIAAGAGALLALLASKRKAFTSAIRRLPPLIIPPPPPHILSALEAASERYSVPLQILVGVAHTESRFNPQAVSSVGAKGLMQLMPVVVRTYGITDPFDPRQSAMGAARFLSKYYRKYGDWQKTLAAYNWGPGNVNTSPRAGQWPEETRTYVAKVQRAVV